MANTGQYQLNPLGGGITLVSTQSTAVQLSTTSTNCYVITIQAISTNTAAITICNSTARALAASHVGVNVWPGSTQPLLTVYASNISKVYIDGVSTEGIYYTYYGYSIP